LRYNEPPAPFILEETKGKERKSIYIVPFYILCISQSAQAWITQFYLQMHHACLSFASVQQMAPPLTQVKDIQLHAAYYSSIDPEEING